MASGAVDADTEMQTSSCCCRPRISTPRPLFAECSSDQIMLRVGRCCHSWVNKLALSARPLQNRQYGRSRLIMQEGEVLSTDAAVAARKARIKAKKQYTKIGGKKAATNDALSLSTGQWAFLGSLMALFGISLGVQYEVQNNPMGSVATNYRGSVVEKAMNILYDNTLGQFEEFSQPFTDKMIPDFEAGPFYGPNIPPGTPPPPLLVLDLEKTLIGSVHDAKYGWRHVKRPGLQKFLDRISQYYEVVIVSQNDVNPEVFMAVDPNSACHKFGAPNCELRNGVVLKRLDLMNRDLSRIILIDDDAEASSLFPRNTLLIKPFEDINDKTDRELDDLCVLLQAFCHDEVGDFRDTFDDLGTRDVSEAVLEYKMRIHEHKQSIRKEREKGLGGLLKKTRRSASATEDLFDNGEASLMSRMVGDASQPKLGFGLDDEVLDAKSVGVNHKNASDIDLMGIGAGKYTKVGSGSDRVVKKSREKKKGALFQLLDDHSEQAQKDADERMQKVQEMYMKQLQEKEEKKKKKNA